MLYIQMILPHQLDDTKNWITFVGFDTRRKKLKKLKSQIKASIISEGVDYVVTDYFANFGTSYILMKIGKKILVISTATGSCFHRDFFKILRSIRATARFTHKYYIKKL